MAQRFKGEFSPNGGKGQPNLARAKRSRVGGRVNLLFFAPFMLIFKAFSSEPLVMATYLAALGSFILGAWLTREGLLAQKAYEARTVARKPAMPRKILGAYFTGLGLGLTGLAGHGALEALIFGGLGVALHLFAFGLDPLKSKGAEGIDEFQNQRVMEAVEDGERQLKAIHQAIRSLNEQALLDAVDAFSQSVRMMFRAIEADPRDLVTARKYLKVYLRAARDASDKFAELYQRAHSPEARQDYLELLADLNVHFAKRTQAFLADDKIDLDIEIGVLRDRLKSEGVALNLSERDN